MENTEFELKTVKGQKVTEIHINIRSDKDKLNKTSLDKEGVFITDHKIALQKRSRIALNDDYITIFDRNEKGEKKESYNRYIEHATVRIVTTETYFANGIFGTLYTLEDTKKGIKKLTLAMQKKVNSEYSFLNNIDIYSIVESFLSIK
jgi:hypothetical protein